MSYLMPYLLMRVNNPVLPSFVCFCPSIACSVPSGRIALLLGINVTSVRLLVRFVRAIPCLAVLPVCQPSFCSNFINCLPVIAGNLGILGCHALLFGMNPIRRNDIWAIEIT